MVICAYFTPIIAVFYHCNIFTCISDPFLPRVVELATTSSERQTKVAACELLHSLVLYTLGRSSQQPGSQRGSDTQDMEQIYKKLFPVLMQLACDVEQVRIYLI